MNWIEYRRRTYHERNSLNLALVKFDLRLCQKHRISEEKYPGKYVCFTRNDTRLVLFVCFGFIVEWSICYKFSIAGLSHDCVAWVLIAMFQPLYCWSSSGDGVDWLFVNIMYQSFFKLLVIGGFPSYSSLLWLHAVASGVGYFLARLDSNPANRFTHPPCKQAFRSGIFINPPN